jgi:hypothetical protein
MVRAAIRSNFGSSIWQLPKEQSGIRNFAVSGGFTLGSFTNARFVRNTYELRELLGLAVPPGKPEPLRIQVSPGVLQGLGHECELYPIALRAHDTTGSSQSFAKRMAVAVSEVTHRSAEFLWHRGPKRAAYESYLDNWVLPRWGEHKLDQVKPVAAEHWLDGIKRAKGTRSGT